VSQEQHQGIEDAQPDLRAEPLSRSVDQVMMDYGHGRSDFDPYGEMAVLIAEVVRVRAERDSLLAALTAIRAEIERDLKERGQTWTTAGNPLVVRLAALLGSEAGRG
jgi:hypothetical protein